MSDSYTHLLTKLSVRLLEEMPTWIRERERSGEDSSFPTLVCEFAGIGNYRVCAGEAVEELSAISSERGGDQVVCTVYSNEDSARLLRGEVSPQALALAKKMQVVGEEVACLFVTQVMGMAWLSK